ncbi:MAG: Spx/MgsR family RNA polymerase-binding regulatory protein [Bacilli bacterium]|nr:Spx/MgsR family RNA polymerase-binding regulatory protein [Bacilli bacterium]
MIKIYTSPSCSSCRKVKKWFDEQNIPYLEKNIFVAALNENELKDMLYKSDNGTEDIISTRSKIIKDSGIDVNEMTIKELIDFIRKNPSILKRPIMVDDRKIQVGYNPDDIRVFIPKARRIAESACLDGSCPDYKNCETAKEIRKSI